MYTSRMPWTKPLVAKHQVDSAGDIIADRRLMTSEENFYTALDVAGNWRSSHGYPLHITWSSLRKRAKRVDPNALVPKRLKRLPSVITKLKRFDTMQLSKMQDLGGCRAVLRTVRKVDKLVKYYDQHPYKALEFVKKYDYIENPKPDGYRSVHLVYRYTGNCEAGAFKGLRVEIQIRSRLQHAWATALEIIDTFTGQGLKLAAGDDSWKRFFALMSTAMAIKEKRNIVPNTTDNITDLVGELLDLCDKLNIPNVFMGLSAGIEVVPTLKFSKAGVKAEAYILTLDSKKRATGVEAFASNRLAEKTLLEMEKQNITKPHIQSVMAKADSVHSLRSAYPNYYADTESFLVEISDICKQFVRRVNADKNALKGPGAAEAAG